MARAGSPARVGQLSAKQSCSGRLVGIAIDLSVVIPTLNRSDRLNRTLAALQRQRLEELRAEVLVVDNSPAADVMGTIAEGSGALTVRVIAEPRRGASAARNAGIRAARGSLLLMLGDDTEPAHDNLLASHVRLHRDQPGDDYAVLGRIHWAPELQADPFLRWLDAAGFQFSFSSLRAGPVDTAAFFYSSHLSAKRSALIEVGGFDEEFPFLAEDTELGIRLKRAGVRLEYRPELVVFHDHPHTVTSFAKRMEVVGGAARKLHELWPDETPTTVLEPNRHRWTYRLAAAIATQLLRAPIKGRLRERAWAASLMDAYARGYDSTAASS